MSSLWSAKAFAKALGGAADRAPADAIGGISIDSRTVQRGDAFFAITGDRFDGHDFVAPALAAGAALAVVSRPVDAPGPTVLVDDVLAALERLAAAARERCAGRIAAITGSVGKTGSKEMLRLALGGQGATHAPPGSFNNHWGVPLTLARMPVDTDYGLFEIGMNHPGEITPLTRLVRPHAALVTTVEAVHSAHFSSVEEIAHAKAEIFDGLEPGGTAVLNRDNPWCDLLTAAARRRGGRIVTFGRDSRAEVRLLDFDAGWEGSTVEAVVAGQKLAFRLGAPGEHLILNALGVLAIVDALGADLSLAAEALAAFSAPAGRGEKVGLHHPDGGFTLIDESYNANPASMRAALALLRKSEPQGKGRRIAVLGDMLELGADAVALHAELREAVEEARPDAVFLAGPSMRALYDILPAALRGGHAETAAELQPAILDSVAPGDVLMIKASLGTGLTAVAQALKTRYARSAGERRDVDAPDRSKQDRG